MRNAFGVLLLYVLAGWLALQLAVPPGYASPLFPSAGIALAAVLAFGPAVLPAIGLASLLLNFAVGLHFDGTSHPFAAVGAAFIIAVGAMLQAGLGAWLVRRTQTRALPLDSAKSILAFFLVAGPLACLVSATVATTALWGFDLIERPLFTWWNWWIGDALGSIIAAPICLAYFMRGEPQWRNRRLNVALPLAILTMVWGLAIAQVQRWEANRVAAQFREAAAGLESRIETRFEEHLVVLKAVENLFQAKGDVSRSEFRRWTSEWLRLLPSLQAIGWYAVVPNADLIGFEARMRTTGVTGFEVYDRVDLGIHGAPTPAPVYRVLSYIEPIDRNRAALGLSAASVPEIERSIERAYRTGTAQATAGIRLAQETAQQTGIVVYRHVGGVAAFDETPETDRGVAFVTMRMDDALNAVANAAEQHAYACILDVTDDARPARLAGPAECLAPNTRFGLTADHRFAFAGREWTVRISARNDDAIRTGDWAAWLFSVSGLLAIATLGALLLMMTGRTRRIEQLVEERTERLKHEVAERVRIEASLRESEQRFREVLDNASIGLTFSSMDGRLQRANPKFCAILGYTPEELRQRTFVEITHPDDVAADMAMMQRLMAGEFPSYTIEKRYLHKDGHSIWVRLTISLRRDEHGVPVNSIAVVENIDEQVRLREAERAREAAEAASRAKSEFLSRMSHELRTPLNAMLGFAQLLAGDEQTPLAGAQRERVDHIQRAGWHLLEMIDEVLDLARIEAGSVALTPVPVRVGPLLGECSAMFAADCERMRLSIAIEPVPDDLAAFADPTRLRQVLLNLLGNAVKYNQAGGSITVRSRHVGDGIAVDVIDTGIGMSADQLEQLFQPFNRLGREQSFREGTGIGLVITKRLVELMNGILAVSSRRGEGTCFTVTLPAAPDIEPDGEPAPGLATVPASYAARRVIYIEDDPVNAELMRGVLCLRPQIDLTVCEDGEQGLALVRAVPPALVLLDLNLPGMHGIEVLRALKSDPATQDVPVLIVSADALGKQIEQALEAGANGYLTKPIHVDAVLAHVDEILLRAAG